MSPTALAVAFIALFALSLVLRPVLRLGIALVAGRAIGKAALARQPDRIRLVAKSGGAWRDAMRAAALAQPLLEAGYQDGGTFAVEPMPGVTVRLLGHVRQSTMAVVYEHPVAGHWAELVSTYADGTSFSVSGSRDTGLAPRPGHAVTHMTGAQPGALHARMMASRPPGALLAVEPGRLAQVFEAGYAGSIAWRKEHGVSNLEVAKVAARKAA